MKNLFVLLIVSIFVNHLFAQKISDYNKPNFENKHFETRSVKSQNTLLDNYDVKFYKIEVDVTRLGGGALPGGPDSPPAFFEEISP